MEGNIPWRDAIFSFLLSNVSINEIYKSVVTFWVLFLISAYGPNQTKGKTADQRDSKKS